MATALNEHIVSSYEDELMNLNKAISEMGGMVEQSITDAAKALLKLDHTSAQDVRVYDKKIDEMKDRINDMAVSIIARRQPMASDLRMVVTAIQVANDLERTGDMAKQLDYVPLPPNVVQVIEKSWADNIKGGGGGILWQ